MALTKGKLGQYIELRDVRNSDLKYGVEDVRGVNTSKQMMPTKADLTTRDLRKFQTVEPNSFVFNHRTSRNGSKFSIAFNDTNKDIICTEDYVVFRLNEYGKKHIVPEWLYMFFNRPEFDRYVITNSWGSSTEFYNWEDICDVDMVLPPLPIQQKYVDIYNSMLANQRCYERGLEDLKLVCDAYIEDLRRKIGVNTLAPYIVPKDERNINLEITLAQGITIEKVFADPKQVASAEKNAKIVRKGQFAYNRATTRNGEKISIAYRNGEDCVVSSAYQVFEIAAKDKLLPEYLMMWFKRSEFDRYARFMSKGSAHEFFEYDDMEEVAIPIPNISVQKAIADIFTAYNTRKQINERLKAQIKDLCPILVKGAVEEGEKE